MSVCYADMALEWVRWQWVQEHGADSAARYHDGTFKAWSKERSPLFPYGAEDGVTHWVSGVDLDPDDDLSGGE